MSTTVFDPEKFKESTRQQWQNAAKAWNDWGVFLRQWLGPTTEQMLDMAGVVEGSRVLDVAAGAGDQTMLIAEAVGAKGHVLATDISSNILEFARENAQRAGLKNVETRVLDGEDLKLPDDSFDAVVSRLGVMVFPHQEKAVAGFHRVLKKGGRLGLIVFSVPENNLLFSGPLAIIRRRAALPAPLPGQPGVFSLGSPGVIDNLLTKSGFRGVQVKRQLAPLRMSSADECVRFMKESFGNLHQMMSRLSETEKAAAWEEIRDEMGRFETGGRFTGPCELVIASGAK
jgi:ubiquinone/menaquinone biosynthesis C-methylase UbiE